MNADDTVASIADERRIYSLLVVKGGSVSFVQK